jgi:XTP/dITP diphosphohydrolase
MSEDPLSPLPTEVILITGNRGKLAEARRLCDFPLDAIEIDLPELQSLDIREILRAKGRDAWLRVRRPILVEETGLELAGLNGFPGPLVKWMLEAIGSEGIAHAAQTAGDNRATARCCLLYFDGETEILGEGRTDGRLILPGRGDAGFGWDPVFQPDGSDRTYAEMTAAQKDSVSHRARAWSDLLDQFR